MVTIFGFLSRLPFYSYIPCGDHAFGYSLSIEENRPLLSPTGISNDRNISYYGTFFVLKGIGDGSLETFLPDLSSCSIDLFWL